MVAVPAAVSCVADTRVVVIAVVPNKIVAPGAKFAPFTVIAKAPRGMEVGAIEEICGIGLFSVTVPLADFVESAVSATPIVTVLGAGGNCGAVYTPPALTIPIATLPPGAPLTDQVRAGVDPSFVFAVNVCVSPPRRVADAGVKLRVAC